MKEDQYADYLAALGHLYEAADRLKVVAAAGGCDAIRTASLVAALEAVVKQVAAAVGGEG